MSGGVLVRVAHRVVVAEREVGRLQAECARLAGERDVLRAALAEVAQDLECEWFDDLAPDEPRSCVEIAAAMDDDAWALDFLPTQPRPTRPCRACRYRLLTQ